MNVYVHTYIQIRIYSAFIILYKHTWIYIHPYIYMIACIHTCVHAYVYILNLHNI